MSSSVDQSFLRIVSKVMSFVDEKRFVPFGYLVVAQSGKCLAAKPFITYLYGI